MRTSVTVHAPWQSVLQRLVRTLREKGFETRRTFDLQLARKLLRSSEEEPCPHHGTAPCSCQYLVLQIGGHGRRLSAVVIHGYDRATSITFLAGTAEEERQDMAVAVYEALEHLQMAGETRRRAGGHDVGNRRAGPRATAREQRPEGEKIYE